MTHIERPDLLPGEQPLSLVEVLNFVFRHRALTLWLPACAMLVVGIARSLSRAMYTSTASFMPQQSNIPSSLAGLAAQFGVSVPSGDQQDSPAFYADLILSREVLTDLLTSKYAIPTEAGGDSATLMTVLDISGATPGLRLERGLKKLASLISVDLQTRTGVIHFGVRFPGPALAQEVARRVLDEVNRFDLEQRQSQAVAERRFTEARLQDLSAELRAAEDSLQRFLQHNATFSNSPALTFQEQRLTRSVDLRQTIYTGVAQENERARIDAVRDTPVITVIESPNLPARRDSRGRLRYGILAFIGLSSLGVLVGVVRDFWMRQRATAGPEFSELSRLLVQASADLWKVLRPWKLAKGARKPG